ncbi:MAG: pirin family protein [Candidatus Aenigmarchaeota archaeon]|nr:pirin family protein [Candidatus Aenigmarchaeota archaeon]
MDIQRSNERGMTKTTWLTSYHSFSFGNYMNPARMNFGLLRVLNDDIIAPDGGFPTHHHDNMEIVTIVLSGSLHHKDSTGGEGIITAGEVQRMSAGRGIYHSEANASQKEPVRLLQIWIDTAEQDIAPSYEQKKFRILKNVVNTLVGKNALRIKQDASVRVVDLEKDREVDHDIGSGKGVYLQMTGGQVQLGSARLSAGDGAGITEAKRIEIRALEDSKFIIIEVPTD